MYVPYLCVDVFWQGGILSIAKPINLVLQLMGFAALFSILQVRSYPAPAWITPYQPRPL